MTAIGTFSATDLATEQIRERIIRDELPPGTKIKIEELASEFGISRTPVRDALTRLQSEGLVQIVSRVGVYVREISMGEVLEVYSVKEALEPVMARWATERSTDEQREEFFESSGALSELAESGDTAGYIDLVVQRRLHLLALSQSDVLASIFRLIDERVRYLRARNLSWPERRITSVKEHMAIAIAVRDGNTYRAEQLTREHVRSARASLIAHIEHDEADEVE
jgi:DNA-binding GntR family transcriptional regulator